MKIVLRTGAGLATSISDMYFIFSSENMPVQEPAVSDDKLMNP